ncbi:ABC transporter substrate-binding protein [Oceanicoccus sagamiensis]|uniref:ABC transporter substrate-binding protein n=1 Tax=Oceanicoccus sagamiensis TaxID=716816 RepID=A0A1X9NIT1_9GAMM|nr:ABC transporter substrate binding protein [Oceanicoccus sagamiensis]ARN74797.1 hypothetical protein BST96_12110 [Oceanicoccus sagamiensis]
MPKVGSALLNRLTTPLLLAVISLCSPIDTLAESIPVTFVVVKNDGIYKKIINSTEQSLNTAGIEIDKTIIEIKKPQPAQLKNNADQIISIGTKAAAFSYQQYPDKAITNALITHSSFQQLAQDNITDANQASNQPITPLFIDQPISRFFALGLQLVPESKTIGLLVGPSNKAQIPNIRAKAKKLGLSVNIALLEPDSNPIKIIEPIMRSSDFFIVLPDRKHINQLAAKWTLPLSYRYRKPLIAYSHKYVDAGALASVYSSPENVASAIAQQLMKGTQASTSKPDNSAFFSVTINRSVARSLRINTQSPEFYQQQIRAGEVTTE